MGIKNVAIAKTNWQLSYSQQVAKYYSIDFNPFFSLSLIERSLRPTMSSGKYLLNSMLSWLILGLSI